MNKTSNNIPKVEIPFSKKNYMVMAGGTALVILGFILMYVKPENAGNPDVIYSFGKTSLPVLIIMFGFAAVAIGIMKKFK